MAIIKLGNRTLGSIAIGGAKIGDIRKLSKSNFIRATLKPTASVGIGVGGNNQSQWLLANGNWNDSGVWDDTQIWND
jgi:hypothetical protein